MWGTIALFGVGAGVILLVGPLLSRAAEELADAVGIAHSIGGMVFWGRVHRFPG